MTITWLSLSKKAAYQVHKYGIYIRRTNSNDLSFSYFPFQVYIVLDLSYSLPFAVLLLTYFSRSNHTFLLPQSLRTNPSIYQQRGISVCLIVLVSSLKNKGHLKKRLSVTLQIFPSSSWSIILNLFWSIHFIHTNRIVLITSTGYLHSVRN